MDEKERMAVAQALMQAPQANNFGPLTPEQQANLERDKIEQSLGPFDFAPGWATAAGAGLGAAFTANLARNWPWLLRYYGPSQGGKYVAQEAAAMMGGPTALGYVIDKKDQVFDRHNREQLMMFGNPRDAEGQPGGFYGKKGP